MRVEHLVKWTADLWVVLLDAWMVEQWAIFSVVVKAVLLENVAAA